jgi:hypothetical protein
MLKPGADGRREVGRGGEGAEFRGGGGLWHITSIGAEGIKRRLPGRAAPLALRAKVAYVRPVKSTGQNYGGRFGISSFSG